MAKIVLNIATYPLIFQEKGGTPLVAGLWRDRRTAAGLILHRKIWKTIAFTA
jgi:hypothetical protein